MNNLSKPNYLKSSMSKPNKISKPNKTNAKTSITKVEFINNSKVIQAQVDNKINNKINGQIITNIPLVGQKEIVKENFTSQNTSYEKRLIENKLIPHEEKIRINKYTNDDYKSEIYPAKTNNLNKSTDQIKDNSSNPYEEKMHAGLFKSEVNQLINNEPRPSQKYNGLISGLKNGQAFLSENKNNSEIINYSNNLNKIFFIFPTQNNIKAFLQNKEAPSDYIGLRQDDMDSLEIKSPEKGIKNIGNTCYMAAILQSLCHTRKLIENLKSLNIANVKKDSIVYEFILFLTSLIKSDNNSYESPARLKEKVAKKNNSYKGFIQQDAMEFLLAFLDLLHEELSSKHEKAYLELKESAILEEMFANWKDAIDKSQGSSIIYELFRGWTITEITCLDPNCRNSHKSFEGFTILSLGFIKEGSPNYFQHIYNSNHSNINMTISELIEKNFQKEILEGENKFKCEKCNKKQKCEKVVNIYELPKILIIHLKRFKSMYFYIKGEFQKDRTNIKIEETIDLKSFVQKKDNKSTKYNLYAIVNHEGDLEFGHYTALCKNIQKNEWIKFNDRTKLALNSKFEMNTSASAYILFYEIQPSTQ